MTTKDQKLDRQPSAKLAEPTNAELPSVAPPVDIYENADEVLLIADFPGVTSDSLTVQIDGSELLIEGVQAAVPQLEQQRPLRLARIFRVPATIDPDGISAELAHGVLRVHLAKSPAARPRRIDVRAA